METTDRNDLNTASILEVDKLVYNYNLGEFTTEDDHFPLTSEDQDTLDKFHNMYFRLLEKKSGLQLSWMGHQTGKVPADLWVYQEMIVDLKPDVILECGTHWGGSALFLANMCQLSGKGRVVTVDLYPKPNRPTHALIDYIEGSSIDPATVETVKKSIGNAKNVLVVLDSNHSKDHVYGEIQAYKDLVPVGGYLVVEDSFLGGHPSHKEYGEGPTEAINKFTAEDDSFVIDRSKERLLFTLNRRGFLRRVK